MMIYFVRHGETEWNREGRFQGREDIPLNDSGVAQAHRPAEFFKNRNISRIITSPLMRARETAGIIADAHVVPVDIIPDERLTERDLGELSGKTGEERKKLHALGPIQGIEPLADTMKRMYECLCDHAGIETDRKQLDLADALCSERAGRDTTSDGAVADTMKYGGKWCKSRDEVNFVPYGNAFEEGDDGALVFVSHGAAINALLALLSNGNIGSGKTVLRNICISTISLEDNTFRILDYDCIDY